MRADRPEVPGEGLEVRPLVSRGDLEQCVDLQRATWGNDFRELVPPAVLTIVQKIGGLALGAFDARDQLAGFVFGITGIADGRALHWSHMLAVEERLRDRGVGCLLKLAQRERLLTDGVSLARWTFDPLVARNAHLNLGRLGVRVLEYVGDMYGENPMSKTDSVIGSDRFVVEWLLAAPVPPGAAPNEKIESEPIVDLAHAEEASFPGSPAVRVAIPRDIQELKRHDPDRARNWRTVTSRAFRHYLTLGYRVAGFHRGRPGAHSTYLLLRSDGS